MRDLGKVIIAKGFKKLPKVQKNSPNLVILVPGLSAVAASGYMTGVAAMGGIGEPEDHVSCIFLSRPSPASFCLFSVFFK